MFLVIVLITTMVVGMFVLIVKSDYRIEHNMISNQDYYPQIDVHSYQDHP